MKPGRRTFLRLAGGAAAAASADRLFGIGVPPRQSGSGKPEAGLMALADAALSAATKAGASYADIRI